MVSFEGTDDLIGNFTCIKEGHTTHTTHTAVSWCLQEFGPMELTVFHSTMYVMERQHLFEILCT